jgi:hypothetical protein
MSSVADVVRQYGAAYLAKFGKNVPREHRKVLAMIARCRTGELGTVVYRCEHCHKQHAVPRSCGNRHCPTCQQHKTKAWLVDQTARLLPTHYFLLMANVLASIAAYETEVRAERVLAGQAAARENGKTWGGSKSDRQITVTDEQINQVLSMRGDKIAKIARTVGLSRPTVYHLLRQQSCMSSTSTPGVPSLSRLR